MPGESHWGRSLVGYSPWGRKESDTTEWLHFRFMLEILCGHTFSLLWGVEITGSRDNLMFNFLGTVVLFQSTCTMSHSCQQCIRFLIWEKFAILRFFFLSFIFVLSWIVLLNDWISFTKSRSPLRTFSRVAPVISVDSLTFYIRYSQ